MQDFFHQQYLKFRGPICHQSCSHLVLLFHPCLDPDDHLDRDHDHHGHDHLDRGLGGHDHLDHGLRGHGHHGHGRRGHLLLQQRHIIKWWKWWMFMNVFLLGCLYKCGRKSHWLERAWRWAKEFQSKGVQSVYLLSHTKGSTDLVLKTISTSGKQWLPFKDPH